MQIQVVDEKLNVINPDYNDKFLKLYFENNEFFPTPKKINAILKQHPEMRKQYSHKKKMEKWGKIELYHKNFADGECCILCLAVKEDLNGMIFEGEDMQICACCGGNPHLSLLTEWKEAYKRNPIDYNLFYKGVVK